MTLIALLITVVIVGVILYVVDQLPMPPVYHTAVRVIGIVFILLLLLQLLGYGSGLHLRC